jgi:hypothetical protein
LHQLTLVITEMTRRQIRLYMWGYQEHYAIRVKHLARDVLQEIGAVPDVEVLLVGVRRPGAQAPHPICIEPESAKWALDLFDELDAEVERAIPLHPLSSTLYGDEPSMQDKPQWTRQAVIQELVKERLRARDKECALAGFVIVPGTIGDYDVAVVIQIPRATLLAHASVKVTDWDRNERDLGFVSVCVEQVLDSARSELIRPNPGRMRHDDMRDASEIVRKAARTFLHYVVAQIDDRHIGTDLFDTFNEIAALRYEGDEGLGRLLLVKPQSSTHSLVLAFKSSIRLRQARWVRKLLQMSSAELPLFATTENILGLGNLVKETKSAISVDFHGYQDWEVRQDNKAILRTRLGRPRLPQESIPEARFRDNVGRLFPETSEDDQSLLWNVVWLQARQPHGSLIIVAGDAALEAERLAQQVTLVSPTIITLELLAHATKIDGALLLDPSGICHAIGAVLDGQTRDECLPSRGARYNSAVRYVYSGTTNRMAMIYSDDRTLDIVPLLLPRISRTKIAAMIEALQGATNDNYHAPMNFLDQHRFYLSDEQCEAINSAIGRIHAMESELGEIRIMWQPFGPNPNMNDTYLL